MQLCMHDHCMTHGRLKREHRLSFKLMPLNCFMSPPLRHLSTQFIQDLRHALSHNRIIVALLQHAFMLFPHCLYSGV
jgi:hypothetical protein